MKFRAHVMLAAVVFTVVLAGAQSFAQYAASPTTLVTFNGAGNGANPAAGLIMDAAGNLWGTTHNGGYGYGEVFEIPKTSTGYATTPQVIRFIGGTSGAKPTAGLIMDKAGNLFGTTYSGGVDDTYGTVFEVTKSGGSYVLKFLVSFYPTPIGYVTQPTGYKPWGGLALDNAGNLYGTTTGSWIGGAGCCYGTVFEIPKTSTGYASTPVTLYELYEYNGETPEGTLIINSESLFGTTYTGTTNGTGAVFKLSLNTGLFRSFPFDPSGADGENPNGENPVAGVIADATGNLFGTTYNGGRYGYGTVFEMAKTSTGYLGPTPLFSFDNTHGAHPQGGLVRDAAGNLFGTTVYGGEYGNGTVFELVGNGKGGYTFTVLVNFNGAGNGAHPFGGLVLNAAEGLFGTTESGGANNYGTVFKLKR